MPKMRALSLLCLISLLCACGDSGPPEKPNVLLVIVDTLRADKLGCYGNRDGLTPSIDALASESLRFSDASAHAPWTLPSIASMLTGLHPKEHGAGGRLGSWSNLDPSVTTLAEVFGGHGYRSHAIANVAFLEETFRVLRDFDSRDVKSYGNNIEVRDATATTDAALRWLDEERDGPFLLLVHYFDAHAVYDPPASFRARFADPRDRDNDRFKFPTRKEMVAIREGHGFPPEQLIRRAEKLHDGEIAYLDGQIGRLLDGLAERGLDGETVVVLTSDHGEEFLDHGGFEHGHTLYQELVHVPLLLRFPGEVEPGVTDRAVSHVDLAQTLCELADLAAPEQFAEAGSSLLRGEGPGAVLAHGNMWNEPLTSLRLGGEKLIQRVDGSYELYDLTSDPGERVDRAPGNPERVKELAAAMEEVQRHMAALKRGEAVELSPSMQEWMEAMGYAGGDDEEDSDDR